jgi:hypothetical protein
MATAQAITGMSGIMLDDGFDLVSGIKVDSIADRELSVWEAKYSGQPVEMWVDRVVYDKKYSALGVYIQRKYPDLDEMVTLQGGNGAFRELKCSKGAFRISSGKVYERRG